MRFGERLIQEHVSFDIQPATIFAIMGGSGCGKSTLLRHMIGLHEPASGHVRYDGMDYWAASEAKRNAVRRRFGVLFQSAALWSSMSVLDNVLLPLEQLTDLPAEEREARAREIGRAHV